MTLPDQGDAAAGPGAGWNTLELGLAAADTAAVRRWAEAVLTGLGEDDLTDALLVISELAANVFDHALLPARLRLRHSCDPCVVSIAAEDASPSLPSLVPPTHDSVRNRGMVLVDCLCADWGVARRVTGKTVWAVLPCAAAS
ncbi:hypothetical protein SAMN05216553_101473 [Lentzea fradiae]|uniref:Histidine kinase/HSP90-like ATPase domain-containing protein n=1 Tax=Lentzea fradiae TaxID=200378 RepID=A0A1G7KUX2_9PSEU|nr:ATP-binding protein [Lentzea fradiae]SDF40529.1 hypothetical protein SAMN05216553_101473 [Lentzea fradiae]